MSTSGYTRWSRNITRKLDNKLAKDRRAIMHIMDVEAEKTKEFIVNTIPVDTGKLQSSVYMERYETDNGYGVGVGIPPTQHSPDWFTNTKLSGWLLEKPNKEPTYADIKNHKKQSTSQQDMVDIMFALSSLKDNVADSIKRYWVSKNNGGK